jgi:FAD/FMN-containing dehydrogenase
MPDISSLRQSFKGDIVTPADPNYKEAIARWAANAERPAKVVAFVKDTNDVALALKYARDNNLQVAIRCGGHSVSGASSAKDGLVVDLSRYYNYAIVDPESRSVRVGGGSLWGTVEREAIKYGLATVAGSVSHVRNISQHSRFSVHLTSCFPGSRQGSRGTVRLQLLANLSDNIPRLLLGGGYGFLTGQYGLVVDNLLQVCSLPATPHDHILSGENRLLSSRQMERR